MLASNGGFTDAMRSNGNANGKRQRQDLTKAACNKCRAGKAKCDGARPECARCIKTKIPCVYDVEEGESRQSALRKKNYGMERRLSTAMDFIEALRFMSLDQQRGAISDLKAAPDLPKFLEAYSNNLSPASSTSVTSESPSQSRQSNRTSVDGLTNKVQNKSPEIQDGLMVRLAVSSKISLPRENFVREAVHAFFEGSSKLFHVFPAVEIFCYLDDIYHGSHPPSTTKLACLCSVAAAGCGYLHPGIGIEVEDVFFHRAQAELDDVVKQEPVKAAKICALLAMRLVFQKHRASLAIVEMGLELCRRVSAASLDPPAQTTLADERDRKRTWRTLFFLAGWLSSTIGYLSESTSWAGNSAQHDVSIGEEGSFEETVNTAMVKVSLLQFEVLKLNLDGRPLEMHALHSVRNYLQEWYHRLPAQMSLLQIQDPSIDPGLRRTSYHCHLMYLSCYILLVQRIIQTEPAIIINTPKSPGGFSESCIAINEAVVAGLQSARILMVLREQGGIYQRCWLSLFHSYTSMNILLYAVARGSTMCYKDEEMRDMLDCVRQCLDILDFSRSNDSVAERFYQVCRPEYEALSRKGIMASEEREAMIQRLADRCCLPFSDSDEARSPRARENERESVSFVECFLNEGEGDELQSPHRVHGDIPPGPHVQDLLASIGPSRFL